MFDRPPPSTIDIRIEQVDDAGQRAGEPLLVALQASVGDGSARRSRARAISIGVQPVAGRCAA